MNLTPGKPLASEDRNLQADTPLFELVEIPEDPQVHNKLVEAISLAGFIVIQSDSNSPFRAGPVYVRNPKPNHPTVLKRTWQTKESSWDYPLSIGHSNRGYFSLDNLKHAELGEYHQVLREIIRTWQASQPTRA